MASLPDKPTALTLEVQRAIVEAMALGSYFEPACKAAGVSRYCVDYWRRLYEAGAEHAQKYADFFTALAKAGAIAERRAIEAIQDGAPAWQSRAWFLERRYPQRWAQAKDRPKKHEASAADVLAEALIRAEELRREREREQDAHGDGVTTGEG